MKAIHVVSMLLVALSLRAIVAAEQSDAGRKQFAEIKVKAENGDPQAQFQLGQVLLEDSRSWRTFEPTDESLTPPTVREAIGWLTKASEQNNVLAQVELGRLYTDGYRVPKDFAAARKWLHAAAERGHPDAQFWLGEFYLSGVTNHQEAAKWLHKAADQKFPGAFSSLASLHRDMKSPLFNPGLARSYLEKGVGAGDGFAQIDFGYELLTATQVVATGQQGDATNAVLLIELSLKALERATNARFRVEAKKYADAWLDGKYLPRNTTNAVYWCGKAVNGDTNEARFWAYFDLQEPGPHRHRAEKYLLWLAKDGSAEAQGNLGDFYYREKRDYVEAVKWHRRAATQGHMDAQYNLGMCYAIGIGAAKDAAEAAKWMRDAAEQGHVDAQYHVGVFYGEGTGVPKDPVEAAKWFRKAAEQGDVNAEFNLGVHYAHGNGVLKDYAEAVKWYRKSADQGFASAQNNLGGCYAQGNGVPKDYVEAHKWFNLASAQGSENGRKSLAAIEKFMTREQVAESQRLAREFKPRSAQGHRASSSHDGIITSRPSSSGTGFFITEDGFLVTNEHVVKDATQIRLITVTGFISAKVVKVDAANDLALLKAEGRFAALPVAVSRGVRLGGTVATVGFPNIGLQGFAPKLAKGEIASLSGAGDDARYFQISVPVQPGNSGGALVDERGNVVGVVSAKLSARAALAASGSLPENVNYAVKSSYLLGFLESVPEVSAKLKEPNTKEMKFEDVVKAAEQAAVLVLVY